jgi:hypothetical protein
MASKKNCWGMLVMVLAFGITLVVLNSCSKNLDRRLNGTWAGTDIEDMEIIIKYQSGKYEFSQAGTIWSKGTYTVSDGIITYNPTHLEGFLFGLDDKLYSKNELETAVKDGLLTVEARDAFFSSFEEKYTINGNTLTLVSPDNHEDTLTKTTGGGKESESTGKSSGRASELVGRWSLEEGPARNNPEEIDLLKDGTGIVDGAGISWKIENGRFYLIHPMMAFSSIYNVSGSTLTLTKEDGVVLKYKKK